MILNRKRVWKETMKPLLMIIEQSENARHHIAEVCQQAMPDIEIVTANNGYAGLQLAQIRTPGVVVMNVMLPSVDGFEVCRQLKADPATALIQVLMIADGFKAYSSHADGVEMCADGYLLKPFNSVELLLQVRSLFRWWEFEKKNLDRLERLVAMRTSALTEGINRLRQEIAQRKGAEEDREHLVRELQRTVSEIKNLRGLLPICCNCKKIRDERGFWNEIEQYILQHTDAQCTHGICPDCIKTLYPNLFHELEVKLIHPSKERYAIEQLPCQIRSA